MENLSTVSSVNIEENSGLTSLEGLGNVSTIDDFMIDGNSALISLAGLENLNTVGNLTIKDNSTLNSLEGLNTLTSVEGALSIRHNDGLISLSGLESLNSIGGDFSLYDNSAIASIDALVNLNTIGGYLFIESNDVLTSLIGLDNVTGVGGNLTIRYNNNLSLCDITPVCNYIIDGGNGTLTITGNAPGCVNFNEVQAACLSLTVCPDNFIIPTQEEVDNFPINYPGCTEIPGNVWIWNDATDNLDGLSQLTSIGGNLIIESFDLFPYTADISGLQNLTSIGGDLRMTADEWTNPSIDAFQNLTSVGGDLDLSYNGFPDLLPLQNLTSVGGSLIIENEYITSLEGLENIDFTTVTNLQLDNNGNLSYCNLPNICEYIENGGTTNISGNATGCATQNQIESRCISEMACLDIFSASSQQEIDDFPSNYPNCTAVGHLDLHFPGDITNLDSLIQLTSVTDYVEIGFFEPNNIADISGLQNITSIGDYLQITGTQLTDLSGFQSLTSIGTYLWIVYNPNLLSLSGLENLDPTTITGLDISSNDNLSVCSLSNICTYLDEGLGSYISISDNSSGCNSEAEVQADCSPTPPDNPCNGTASTDSLSHIYDEDLFIDGLGFANNPSITFPAPANAMLSDISLELYFRLNGNTCENEIAVQITDPAGTTHAFTAYTTCDGGTGLYYIDLNVPSGSSGAGDWLIEFDDTNDQNADYEYSVRFARLNYVATTGGGSGETIVNEVSDFADSDLFIDGVGFENNGTYTFADPGTPADAVLSDISLELYFRLNGSSCENEIAIQITDPAGNTQPLTAYTTCDGGTGLFYVNLDVPSGSTTGSPADWVVEFDDTNDQNSDYEYSVRFGRLTYTTTYTDVATPVIITDEVVRIADSDLFIDGVGFDNNPTYTFYDPATPANAELSDIQLELYFRLNGASCENEIAIQLTDPAGNTQSLTAYASCDGGTGLYYINLNVPSASVTGEIAPWIVRFDDTNDQNTDYEYSVRFGRLTYTTQYDLCDTQMMIVEENEDEQQQLNNSSTQRLDNSSTRQPNNSSLKLYPVPASQHLNVEYFSENINPTNIEIISNEGKTLMSSQEFSQEGINTIQLDIADLPAGHYHIRMYNASDMQMQSFVKIAP